MPAWAHKGQRPSQGRTAAFDPSCCMYENKKEREMQLRVLTGLTSVILRDHGVSISLSLFGYNGSP